MSLRLFAAIAIPEDVRDRLRALQRGVPAARWRSRENLHLTLRFFGETPEPVADDLDACLDQAAGAAAAFDLSLAGAGAFGGAEPHTLWIGVAPSPGLVALQTACERAARRAGLKPELRKFAPHVTLASLGGAGLERVQAFEARLGLFQSRAWRVERFGLYSSWLRRGAASLYRLEAEYELRG